GEIPTGCPPGDSPDLARHRRTTSSLGPRGPAGTPAVRARPQQMILESTHRDHSSRRGDPLRLIGRGPALPPGRPPLPPPPPHPPARAWRPPPPARLSPAGGPPAAPARSTPGPSASAARPARPPRRPAGGPPPAPRA